MEDKTARNKVNGTNAYALSVVTCSFRVVKWIPTEIDELKRNVRFSTINFSEYRPKFCKQRIHL